MLRHTFPCVLLSLILVPAVVATSPAAAPPKPMAAFERFVGGQWIGGVHFPDGKDIPTRTVYAWGVAENLLRSEGYVGQKPDEFEKSETLIYWHPKEQRFKYTSVGRNGSIVDGTIELQSDGSFLFPPGPDPNGSSALVKQVITFTDRDHYVWSVSIQQPGASTWTLAVEEKAARTPRR